MCQLCPPYNEFTAGRERRHPCQYRRISSETYRRLTRDSGKTGADEFVRLFIERADAVMLDYIVLFESVRPAVKQLIENGLTLGIVSTKYRRRIAAFLQREDLTPAFKVVVGGEDVTAHNRTPSVCSWPSKNLDILQLKRFMWETASWTRKRPNALMWRLWRFFPALPQKNHSAIMLPGCYR